MEEGKEEEEKKRKERGRGGREQREGICCHVRVCGIDISSYLQTRIEPLWLGWKTMTRKSQPQTPPFSQPTLSSCGCCEGKMDKGGNHVCHPALPGRAA